jgi:pyruvate-ferredoxin/flavodoxin oxidoreductase
MSKATPRGAVAKFAAGGKRTPKKDLALMAMTYGHVYVAQVAMGAQDAQTLRALREAEAYRGPALIIAYSPCIAHGYDLRHGADQQKAAVLSGHWPLLRYHPDLAREGHNPLQLDSKPPSLPARQYLYNETRYTMLAHREPLEAARLLEAAQADILERWRIYEYLAARPGHPAAVAVEGAPADTGGGKGPHG